MTDPHRRLLILNWQDRENPQAGGAEAHLHQVFGRLADRGWEVHAVTAGWPGAEPRTELDGIQVHRVGTRHTYPLRVAGYVRRSLTDHPFHVVVEDLNKVPVFAPWWAPAPTVLLVHHLFGGTAFQEASLPVALVTWLLERPIPRAYRDLPVIAVSESTRQDLVRRGMDGHRIEVIPNGIDLEDFTPGEEGDRFPDPTLLYLGRLKRYKRVDLVLATTAELRRQGLPVRLLVAGRGDHREALEKEAGRLGLAEGGVEFLGFVPEERKLELLRRSWVHLLTSPKEGWGIANLEAAACGTPTVASDAPGLRDSVRHGETGFLVPHGDVGELARRTGSLLTDHALRRRQAIAARRFAEGFSWEASAEAMDRALRRGLVP
jgi:glycosyltransferase involved in cell wall biosynthesis